MTLNMRRFLLLTTAIACTSFLPFAGAHAGLFGSGGLDASSDTAFSESYNSLNKELSASDQEAFKKALVRIFYPREEFDGKRVFSDFAAMANNDSSYDSSLKEFKIKDYAEMAAYDEQKQALFKGKSAQDIINLYARTEKDYLEKIMPQYKERLDKLLGTQAPKAAETPATASSKEAKQKALSLYPISGSTIEHIRDRQPKQILHFSLMNTGPSTVKEVNVRLQLSDKGASAPSVDEVIMQSIPGGLKPGEAKKIDIDISTIYMIYFRKGVLMPDKPHGAYDYKVELDDVILEEGGSVATKSEFARIKDETAKGFAANQAEFENGLAADDKRRNLEGLGEGYLLLNKDALYVNTLSADSKVATAISKADVETLKKALLQQGVKPEILSQF